LLRNFLGFGLFWVVRVEIGGKVGPFDAGLVAQDDSFVVVEPQVLRFAQDDSFVVGLVAQDGNFLGEEQVRSTRVGAVD